VHCDRLADPWCLAMLSRHAQNLYRAKLLWSEVDYTSAAAFALQWLAVAPDDARAQARVLANLIDWFGSCEHEWPRGILYGCDDATVAQCEDILQGVREARALDQQGTCLAYLDPFEAKVQQYMQRLLQKSAHSDA
jgi:hypothetical protein